MFTYSTISWFTGFAALLFTTLNNGIRIASKEKFNPKHFSEIVKKHKVTTSIISVENGTLLFRSPDFNSEDFLSTKEFLCGGERVPCNVREFLKSKLPQESFGVIYGATETGVVATSNTVSDTKNISDNIVGDLRPNVMVKVFDLLFGKLLEANQVGEILIKSEMTFKVSLK